MRIHLVFITALHFTTLGAQAQDSSLAKPDIPSNASVPANTAIDFAGFLKLTGDLQPIRDSRRIPIAEFNEMSRDPQTIILDTRSKQAFDVVHVAGAIHLNFSDFTSEKLRKVIPNKQTRILIYCNNNFRLSEARGFDFMDAGANKSKVLTSETGRKSVEADAVVEVTTNKMPQLALNIPTFVNLHGYGYRNVYELADQLELNDSRLNLAGTGITAKQPEPRDATKASKTSFESGSSSARPR